VKVLSVYRRVFDPLARLRLVGSPLGERYGPALAAFVHDLGLDEVVEITGSVDPSVLEAYFRDADVFVCASEHEGFCVPIVEAMGHGVPVVAYSASAVPETVGDAGLLLATKDPLRFAAAIHRVATDAELRRRLSEAGRRRVDAFGLAASAAHFVDLVREAAGARPPQR
jgi:glycosyltransferase involved in cell wall biosynthesis